MLLVMSPGSSTLLAATVHCLFPLCVLLSFLLPLLLGKIDVFARARHRHSRRVDACLAHCQRSLSFKVILLLPDLIGSDKVSIHVAHSTDVLHHNPTTLHSSAWVVMRSLDRPATFHHTTRVEEFAAAFDFAAAGVCVVLQRLLQLLRESSSVGAG